MSRGRTPLAEKIAGGLGALMLLGTVAYLAGMGIGLERGAPDPRFRVSGIEKAGGGYLVRVEIRNASGATAQGFKVAGTLVCDGVETERSEVELQYLPSLSTIRCGLFFTRDPAPCSVSFRPMGFVGP